MGLVYEGITQETIVRRAVLLYAALLLNCPLVVAAVIAPPAGEPEPRAAVKGPMRPDASMTFTPDGRILGPVTVQVWPVPVGAGDARARGDGVKAYLTPDGRLKHQLQLTNVGPGEGGLWGTVWTIEPSGKWQVARFAKGGPGKKPLRAGKLTPRQLAALAHHLAAQDLLRLPKEFGEGRPLVPHLLTIRFGKKSTTLDCGEADDLTDVAPPPHDPQATAWSRMIALVYVIENMTRQPKAPVPEKKVE